MPSSIFITRDETVDSPFFQTLRNCGHHVSGHSLIIFQPLDFEIKTLPDWFFFYSKNGVRFFYDKIKDTGSSKIAAFGPSTAKAINAITNNPIDFVGTGESTKTADSFLKNLNPSDEVCFIKAHQSIQSIHKSISEYCSTSSISVYNNQINPPDTTPRADVYVVTSPLNVQALLSNDDLHPDTLFVAIGQTTCNELHKMGMMNSHIAEEPNEPSLAQSVMNLLNS